MIEHAHIWGGGWWIFPMVMMVFMMFFCFFGMRRWFGSMGTDEGFRGCWPSRWGRSDSAIQILNRRYARGEIEREIDREEYELRRRAIEETEASDRELQGS